tara:strand:+ start:155 stop:388 length:234 start_codon:yes stop_codon:yes gene_type:complete
MITAILVIVAMNFFLLCLNEYGSLKRAENTITIMHRLNEEAHQLLELQEKNIERLSLQLRTQGEIIDVLRQNYGMDD